MEAFDKRARAIAAKSARLMELEKAGKLVGISLAKVERLIGPPTSTEGQTVIYRLDTGFGGLEWKLEHRGGKVIGVTRLSMN